MQELWFFGYPIAIGLVAAVAEFRGYRKFASVVLVAGTAFAILAVSFIGELNDLQPNATKMLVAHMLMCSVLCAIGIAGLVDTQEKARAK